MKYTPVSVPENLFKSINGKDKLTTKIQNNWFDSDRFIGQDDHFDETEDDGGTWSNKVNYSEDESQDKADSPHQFHYMASNTMFHQ